MSMLHVTPHEFSRHAPRPVRGPNGTVVHIGRCVACGASATRMNPTKKKGKGYWVMNPHQPLVCLRLEGAHPMFVIMQPGPLAGPMGARPLSVAVNV